MIVFFHSHTTFSSTEESDDVVSCGIHSSIVSAFDCALLYHQDPQCPTFVFDLPSCRLYETFSDTDSIVVSPSTTRVIVEIVYDN